MLAIHKAIATVHGPLINLGKKSLFGQQLTFWMTTHFLADPPLVVSSRFTHVRQSVCVCVRPCTVN